MMRTSILRQTLTITAKDLRRELRSREVTTTTVFFSVVVMLVFVFSFYRNARTASLIFPGILWVSILFTSTLSLTRSFADERDSGCLRALALIPGTSTSLYFGKLLTNLVYIAAFELALVPLLVFSFEIPFFTRPLAHLGALTAGTLGIASVGTFLSAMLVHHRLRDILLPLILYPLLVPVLIASVKATQLTVSGQDLEIAYSWIRMLLGVDALVILGAPMLFGDVLRAIE
jgi:heme exporter protein B